MPRLTSSLETVEAREAIPEGLYKCRVHAMALKSSGAGNDMIETQFEVVDGENKARRVFTNIMIGGKQKDGQPMNTFMLMNFIDAFKEPWSCTNCKNSEEPRPFLKQKVDGRTKFFCPDCKTPARITYDTDVWVAANHFAAVKVTLEDSKTKDGAIKRDSDGNPQKRNGVDGFSAIA